MAKETKTIQCKGSHQPNIIKFLKEFQELAADGWVLDEECRSGGTRPLLTPRLSRIPLMKEVAEAPVEMTEEEKEASIEKGIKSSEKIAKADLLWFAGKRGITIPEEAKVPLAIRKVIKESLQ